MPLTHPTTAQPASALPDVPMAHYKAIVQSSDDAVISKTLEGVVTSWNPGAQAMFGYTAEEMVGSSLLRLFPPTGWTKKRPFCKKSWPVKRWTTSRRCA